MRPLFVRERSNSYYRFASSSSHSRAKAECPLTSPSAWLLSRLLFDVIPLRILPTIIVSTMFVHMTHRTLTYTHIFPLRTYWMAGLAHDAAHFFKFLFILVLFTLVMTLFVRGVFVGTRQHLTCWHVELPACNTVPQWGYRDSCIRSDGVVPNDVRRFLCPSGFHTTCTTMVAVVVSSQGKIFPRKSVPLVKPFNNIVYSRSAVRKRGRIRAYDYRRDTRRPAQYSCGSDLGDCM